MKLNRWHVMGTAIGLAAVLLCVAIGSFSDTDATDGSAPAAASNGTVPSGGAAQSARGLASPEERWVTDYTQSLVASEKPLDLSQLEPVMGKAADDPNPAVRAVALTSLARFKKNKSQLLPTMFQGMRDPNPLVRKRAVLALQSMTDTRFPAYKPEGSPKSRKKALAFIEQYFRDESNFSP